VRQYTKEVPGESNWVTHLEFDDETQRLILIADDRVSCVNCRNGELISLLSNIHEAPLTGCVWYNRSQCVARPSERSGRASERASAPR
jgi:hypothetical protein